MLTMNGVEFEKAWLRKQVRKQFTIPVCSTGVNKVCSEYLLKRFKTTVTFCAINDQW